MPGGRDYNKGRPPRRKSWEEEDSGAGEDTTNRPYRASDYDPKPEEPLFGQAPPPTSTTRSRPGSGSGSTSASRAAGRNGANGRYGTDRDDISGMSLGQRPGRDGSKKDDDSKNDDDSKKGGRKRLFKLLGNEALCLLIIFGLIAAYNWIATDYSGDYLGQVRQLRLVQLSLTRRATTIDAELNYGASGMLELDTTKDHPSPRENKAITLYFATPERWRTGGRRVWKAVFKGKIDGGKAVGTISDTRGTYKVTLEKNVLTSLFRQAQAHLPRMPEIPLPSLFNEDEKTRDMQNSAVSGVNQNQNQTNNSGSGASNGIGGIGGIGGSSSSTGNGNTGSNANNKSGNGNDAATGLFFNGPAPPTNGNNSGNLSGNPKWYVIDETNKKVR